MPPFSGQKSIHLKADNDLTEYLPPHSTVGVLGTALNLQNLRYMNFKIFLSPRLLYRK
jgi:hypothetical protein